MIYYVEDDQNIRELVLYTLKQQGFDAMGFPDAKAFWRHGLSPEPELILLDVMLPGGEDGIAILSKLRATAATKDIPVIMLTAKGAEYDKVKGLDTGADDYITKPFGMMELLARIRAAIRRGAASGKGDDGLLRAGAVHMDVGRHVVTVNGQDTALTLKEFQLLKCLLENKGHVLTREQLLSQVWDYGYDGGTRTVDVHVQTLRQKLGEAAALVETVRGLGYRVASED